MQFNGFAANSSLAMANVTPSLFSMDETGSGPRRCPHRQHTRRSPHRSARSRLGAGHPGDYLEVYCTGLGTVNPASPTAPRRVPSPLSHRPHGHRDHRRPSATVLFSGLTPGIAGLYVVDVQIPVTVQTGKAIRTG